MVVNVPVAVGATDHFHVSPLTDPSGSVRVAANAVPALGRDRVEGDRPVLVDVGQGDGDIDGIGAAAVVVGLDGNFVLPVVVRVSPGSS